MSARSPLPVRLALHAVLIIVAFASIYPLFIMVSGSFKDVTELFSNSTGLPIAPTLNNYRRLLTYNSSMIMRTYFNAVFVSAVYTLLTLFVASMAGFVFSKYRFRGKEALFLLLLFTMMVPTEVNITPLYLIFSRLGWLNTYQVQIFPGLANVFAMFLCRQNMDSIPNSIVESARIDGASHWKVYKDIIVPASAPTLGALAILVFLGKWNDYLFPKMMINKPQFMTIMVILPTLRVEDGSIHVPWDLVLSSCTIVTIPLIILFLIFPDKFLASVTIGAVKE